MSFFNPFDLILIAAGFIAIAFATSLWSLVLWSLA